MPYLDRTSTFFSRVLLCALATGACVPAEGGPDTATDPQTSDDSGEPQPDPTTGAGADSDATDDPAPTTDATTGEPAEVDPCGVADPQLFFPEPYVAIGRTTDEECVLVEFGPADDDPTAQVIDFSCIAGGPAQLKILGGPRPDWTPYVGEAIRVVMQRVDGGETGRDQEMVSVGRPDRVLYASARMQERVMPALYTPIPVYPSATQGDCEFASTADDPGAPDDDAFWCTEARRDRLSLLIVDVGEVIEAQLESGQSITVPVPNVGGSYEVEAGTIVTARGCAGAAPEQELYTVAFAIAFHAE